jgi:hypothetical protein
VNIFRHLREPHASGVKFSRIRVLCKEQTLRFIGLLRDNSVGIVAAKEIAEPG